MDEHDHDASKAAPPPEVTETAVRAEQLVALNEQLLAWPTGFNGHPRLGKQLERRREAMGEAGGIDWGHAESLAFASLLAEGSSVRVTGQDAERGTFSHRHAVLHDPNTGQTFTPLQHLPNAKGTFEIYNSPLSETGVLGFEYGYSTAADDTLVLWEAQFGDFVNVAQPIIDQFIAADRAKWGQDSGGRAAAAARLRRAGPGALERPSRAVPAALRGGQHVGRLSVDARAVLPHPAASGAAPSRGARWC